MKKFANYNKFCLSVFRIRVARCPNYNRLFFFFFPFFFFNSFSINFARTASKIQPTFRFISTWSSTVTPGFDLPVVQWYLLDRATAYVMNGKRKYSSACRSRLSIRRAQRHLPLLVIQTPCSTSKCKQALKNKTKKNNVDLIKVSFFPTQIIRKY